MIGFLVILFLIGLAVLIVGIYQQKTVYGNPNYQEAEVVGYAPYRSTNIMISAVGNLAGVVVPIVKVMLNNGEIRRLKLHLDIPQETIKQFPELGIGGKVDVLFFGENPKEAFLMSHPLSQSVVRFSILISVGVALMLTAVGLYLFYLSI